jgi:lactate dehydrogenase-like 2-hydroxyacid dehydrogenase
MSKTGFEKFPDLEELTACGSVILSGHVAFYTDESVRQIAEKTLENLQGFIGQRELDEKSFVV